MKTCPNCGQWLDDSAKFCNNCGSSLQPAAQQAAQFCSNCGQRLAAGTVFCINCGTPAGNPGNPVPPQPSQPMGARPNPGAQPNAGYRYTAGSVPPSGRTVPNPASASPTFRASKPDIFCPNCGEKIPADSAFCPNCHIIVQPQHSGRNVKVQPKSGKSKAPLFIASAAAIVVLIVAAVLVVPRLLGSRSPEKAFVSAQEEIFVTPLLNAMETEIDTYGSGKLSTDVTLSASVNSAEINRYLADSSVVLKLDMNQDSMLAGGDLIFMGSPVLSGTLTYEDGRLGFYLPELDNSYYVMDLSTMLASMGIYDVDLSNIKLPELSGKECRALAETYLDLVYTVVTKDNVTVAQRQNFSLPELGGSYTGTVYTFTPTAKDVQAMLVKLADHLENDKDLRSLILKLVNPETLLLSMSGYASYDYYYNSNYNYDFESELDEALRETARQIREEAQYMDPTQDLGLTWTLYMEGKEVRMVRLENSYDYGYSSAIVFERTGTESKGCTQRLYQESYGEKYTYFTNTYTKKGDVYDGMFTVSDDYSYESFSVSYNADTGRRSVLGIPYGSYSLYAPYEDVRLSMEVSEGKSGSTDHVITIQGDDYTFDGIFTRLDLTINTTKQSSAQKPSQPPTDITYYSESELGDLMYYLSSRLEDELYDVMYGLW